MLRAVRFQVGSGNSQSLHTMCSLCNSGKYLGTLNCLASHPLSSWRMLSSWFSRTFVSDVRLSTLPCPLA